MLLEDLKIVSDTIKNVVTFIQNDEVVKGDFEEYLKTIGIGQQHAVMDFNTACLNYIFERRLQNKPIVKLYLDRTKKLSGEEKKVCEALLNSIHSVFEIKRVLKNGFSLYSVINEKTYDAISLVKMTAFRGVGVGQYVVARITKYGNEACLLEISGILPSTRREDALRYSIAKLVETPELAYQDNPEKQAELEAEIETLYQKFVDFFGVDEVITTSKLADDVIGAYNEFAELGNRIDIKDHIQEPEIYKFFNVTEFNNSYSNFLENSLGGFSSHEELYDVGIIYDRELGLYAVPFYKTFCKIFEAEDYKTIEGYEECVKFFLENDKLPANLIKRVAAKYPDFMDRVNEIMKSGFTLDGLLQQYKPQYLEKKIFSPTSVLYKSKAFSNTLGIIEEEEELPELPEGIDFSNVGRNDPCPCGSGKKFKKCCGAGRV